MFNVGGDSLPHLKREKKWQFSREPQPYRWVILTTPPGWMCFCRHFEVAVFTGCPQKYDGQSEWMNEWKEWRVKIGAWRRGERINHPVRTTPPDWKNSRGFSLSLFSYLSIFSRALLSFSVLCRDLVHLNTLLTCMHVVIFCITRACIHAFKPVWMADSRNQIERSPLTCLTSCSRTC